MNLSRAAKVAVLVASLGYFVDVFDLILFSVLRVPSLRALGLGPEELLSKGILLLNCQMLGMLLGGVLFGIMGDRRGRLSVLFGSILLYSVANLANGFVWTVPQYAVLRFISGVGLAGELGAGITLVSELLPREKRGLGTTLIASIGVLGAIVASLVARELDWRHCYMLGGVIGLGLLALRVSVQESGLFVNLKSKEGTRGDLRLLLRTRERASRFLCSLLPGLPIWFVLGILVTFGPEILKAKGFPTPFSAGSAVFYSYVGFFIGDLGSGLLSQFLRTRKTVIAAFIVLSLVTTAAFLYLPNLSTGHYEALYVGMGTFAGYWAVFITVAAEQFGTNLRATVATSAPNFIRGTTVPLTLAFNAWKGPLGTLPAVLLLALLCSVISLWSLSRLDESFHRDLDFLEL